MSDVQLWTSTCPLCKTVFSTYVPESGFSHAHCPNCEHELLSTRIPRKMGFWGTDLEIIGHVLQGFDLQKAFELAGAPSDTGYRMGARSRLMQDGVSDTQIDGDVLVALRQLWSN